MPERRRVPVVEAARIYDDISCCELGWGSWREATAMLNERHGTNFTTDGVQAAVNRARRSGVSQVFLMDGVEFGNIMIDMETWGTCPGAAIRSIGAVEFNPRGKPGTYGDKFYANITDQSCLDAGLIKEPGTVAWWARQSQAAQAAFAENPRPLAEVLAEFSAWYRRCRGVFPWSQGANFDQPLLEVACRAVGQRAPYKYSDSRDTRTAYDLGELGYGAMPRRAGTHHNALDDAVHQAHCVQLACSRIRIVEGK